VGDGEPLSRVMLILCTYAYVRMFVNIFFGKRSPFLDSVGSLILYRLIFCLQMLIETIAMLMLIKSAIIDVLILI
jgi:hypothetical protein